jgi:ABC-type glutathione transport system ATPase component
MTALVLTDQSPLPDGQKASLLGTSRAIREECIDATTLQLTNVGKIFDQLEAIRSISLAVAKGEFVSLLGPSGCGKSTLLLMMAGLITPTSGNVIVGGSNVRTPRADVGVVFQTPILLPWRSVLDNVLLPIEFLNLPRKNFIERAYALLKMVKPRERLPRMRSGGWSPPVGPSELMRCAAWTSGGATILCASACCTASLSILHGCRGACGSVGAHLQT